MENLSIYAIALNNRKSHKNVSFSETSCTLRLIGGVSNQSSVAESFGTPDRLKITDTGSSWTYVSKDDGLKVFFNQEGILNSYRITTNKLNNTGEK